MNYDVCVIGGGPSGMAAAVAAHEQGAKVVIIERDERLGGILNQCIHNGFGLHFFGAELTGPEYAQRFADKVNQAGIDVLLNTMALEITPDKVVKIINSQLGVTEIQAKAVVLSMGCRERSAGAIAMCGSRPSGVYAAGMAQRLININGYMVGKRAVILGSGDIGLIMARRLVFEGAKVEMIMELMPYSSGLNRNIVQCVKDFDIPLQFSTTITRIVGKQRVEGVYYAQVDQNLKPIKETEKFIECDTVLLSVGLIPENDLIGGLEIQMDRLTGGAVVDNNRQTSISGFFACGNSLHVHDLVDNVSGESQIAGTAAGKYALGKLECNESVKVTAKNGVRYALPHKICKNSGEVKIFFRVDGVYKNVKVTATSGTQMLFSKKHMIMSPGEMDSLTIDSSKLDGELIISLDS